MSSGTPVQSAVDLMPGTARSPYTDEQRFQAVTLWMMAKTYEEISELTNIPKDTLIHWKNRTEWWPQLENSIRAVNEREFRYKSFSIIMKAMDRTLERLEQGDPYVTRGEVKYMPVKARDTALIYSMTYDKHRMSLNLPTRIIEKQDSKELERLKQQFESVSRVVLAKNISEEPPSEKDPIH